MFFGRTKRWKYCCLEKNKFLEMYEKGKFPIDQMISESFDLKDINIACSKLENGEITGRSIIKF